MFDWLLNYFSSDKPGSLKVDAPLGFTGQGAIWYKDDPPAGWLLCDGALVSKDDYPDLWILLQDTWGVSTTTHFYIPDLRGRVAVGQAPAGGTFNVLGNTGGSETHTLTSGQIPSHVHPATTRFIASGAHGHTGVGGFAEGMTGGTVTSQNTGNNAGGGGSHNNLQPYNTVNYIIKS